MKMKIRKAVVVGSKSRTNTAFKSKEDASAAKFQSSLPAETAAQGKLRVAAYCRVSTLAEEQDLSYETQCSYYQDTLRADPNMELVGVYGDHGSSGLRLDERHEFQRMLRDCEAGKIDAVYTKSVSRLARNAIDCQKALDHLHQHGVYVYFEKENIRSDDAQLNLILKFLSSVAQEESNSQSQSIKWVVDHNAEIGKPAYKCCYGYRKAQALTDEILPKGERHNWIVFEKEAETVRLMFGMILRGFTTYEVAKQLTARELKNGSCFEWKSCKIPWMLKNVAYKGDIQTHKTVVLDYLSGKAVPNHGLRDSFYLKGHHEPIICEKEFDAVQKIIEERGRIWKEKRS